VVSGSGYGTVVETSLTEKVLNGAEAKPETQGEGMAVEPFLLVGLPQGNSDGLADGARHDASLLLARTGAISLLYLAQNLLSGFSAKRDVRQQERGASRSPSGRG
jgi:hypothetical protein